MSDIVIRNIEIPKDNKRLAVFIDKDGNADVFDTDNKFVKITDAVELPEPHGELVDKNKFLEVVERFRDAFEKEGDADFVKGLLTHPMVKPILEASK